MIALAGFAERFAVPVVQHKPRYLSLPSAHPMNLGYDPNRWVSGADLVIVLEDDVPWLPVRGGPPEGCRVIQCGFDPLFVRYPVRGFACDLGITGGAAAILAALGAALEGAVDEGRISARRRIIGERREQLVAEWRNQREKARPAGAINPAFASHCIDRAKPADAIIVNEYTLQLEQCDFVAPGSYFGSSAASGLGWGAAAALGVKLARPDRTAIAVLGDGAYIFSNPVAVHHAAALHGLPVLFVVMNNGMWGAVRRSMLAMYPDGAAASSNDPAFIGLDRLPAFETICAAAGGYGERVSDPAQLPDALDRGLAAVREGRQALLNVICAPP